MSPKSRSQNNDIVVFLCVLTIVGVYTSHLFLDDLVAGVQWVAAEVVSPMFQLDSYF